ncbi:MAG: iron ABC transporter permease [Brevinematales bacterium]|nr:iron ABC transporter permease [Brevinematales bacterium]
MRLKIFFFIFLFFILSIIVIFYGYFIYIPEKILFIRLNIFFQALMIASILSLSGVVLQILLSNPLAEPYLIGVSGAASLGSVVTIFLSLKPIFVYRSIFSISASLIIITIIFFWSRKKNFFSITKAILIGVSFNALFSSLIILLQSFLLPNDFYASIRWLMGNFDYLTFGEMLLLLSGAVAILIYVIIFRKELFIYQTGEEMALSVGVDTNKLKITGFLVVAYSTGISVSISGMIGFIGLIVPHIARIIFKDYKENSIISVLLIGNIIITISLFLSRNMPGGTIVPIGVITSLIGAPFFIHILLKNNIKT